ncbi:hypothetical protein SCLCIDRAFT_20960 [Scleroderma citrinum Foug A]|uniref:Uncharacterized protein n=1 Tax=Scleroderma citrinum Foug A TaxID=1036808 RepID=A0A0C3EHN2_9AGAM|nr:hypothetical protein SCLCIDRAFT_20960 [Scleroderma citrinum Foug A]
MSDYYRRHSQTPPGRAGDISDKPMSPPERAQRHSDKRRASRMPSPRRRRSPSHEGQHKKCCCVTACNASPPSDQWCSTTTGLLVHDQDPRCTMCLEYQKHVSMDIVLETPSIMATCESALWCLSCLFGRSGREAVLKDDLVAMRRKHDYWRRCAKDAEKALDFSQKQASAAFEQARLLSMYILSACPEDTPGAGPSSQPLEEHLHTRLENAILILALIPWFAHASALGPREPSLATWSSISLNHLNRPGLHWQVGLKNPRKQWGEVPNRIQVLLDGKKFLHIQFNDCVYQFEEPRRRDVLRNINRGIMPPITGAIWPGAVPLLNTKAKLDRLYTLVAQESDEQNSPNTRLGQTFVAWLNRYMGDVDCITGKKPPKTDVIIHALKKWRPPAWASAHGKSKRNGYKQAHQAQRDQLNRSTSQPPASIPETAQPPAASTHHPPTPEAVQPPATSSSFAPAPATASTHMFSVVSTSREPMPAPVPPLILTWQQRTTHKQDGLPKGAPSWGDKIAEWRDFVHRLSWAGFAGSFPGVSNHADPEHTEPPTD